MRGLDRVGVSLAIDWLALAVFQLPSSMAFNSRDYLSVALDASPSRFGKFGLLHLSPDICAARHHDANSSPNNNQNSSKKEIPGSGYTITRAPTDFCYHCMHRRHVVTQEREVRRTYQASFIT